ncbi:MAG: T9SS type A sorting domain-containing protein [Allomuricauda sp.]|jgi:SprB repeat/Secretion system C-terminal sorting domain
MKKIICLVIFTLSLFKTNNVLGQYYESEITITFNRGLMFDGDFNEEYLHFVGYSFYQDQSCVPPPGDQATQDAYNVCTTDLYFLQFTDLVSHRESIITSFNPFENNIIGRLDAYTSIPLKQNLQNAGPNLFSVNYSYDIPNFEECTEYFDYDGNTEIISSIKVRVTELGKNLESLNPQYQNDNSIGCGDNIDLNVNACGIGSHYALEYQIWDSNDLVQDWEEAISYGYHEAPSLGIEDLPGAESGYSIKIRLRYVESESNDNNDYSDILTFVFDSCSPQLIPPIVPHKTTCVQAEDGSFTMTLDRDLEENEELLAVVYKENDFEPNVYDVLIGNASTQDDLIDNGDQTFTFPSTLSEGNHIIKYQSYPTGGKNEALDMLYNSLEFSDPFQILPPPEVTFSLQKLNDVYCYSGSDGRIEIEASGGTGSDYQYRVNNQGNWKSFNNGNVNILSDLAADDYIVQVRDGNQCEGTSEDDSETIIEPLQPISAELFGLVEPTAYGFTDGSITVDVSGGTLYQNNSYNYTWHDEDDNPINITSAQYVNNVYRITLENVTAGTYTLTVTDANYNQADNKGGCMLVEDFELTGPPQLQLTVEETLPISCNSANNYNNPSNDGQLTAIASGGVPPYDYFWSKKDDNDDWQAIPNNNSEVLSNLEAGEYSVNIVDANNITIGIYENNQLQQATPLEYALEEPELLTVQIDKTDINCFGGADGTATAIVSGGTPPFEYLWSTGETAETAEGLWFGNHTVYVLDARGCEAEAEVTIDQPDTPVSITNPEYVQPTAYGFTDGSITVQVNGGTPFNDDSYYYEWRDGQNKIINTTSAEVTPDGYAIQANDIPAGTYTITITDANYENAVQKEGCTYVDEFVLTEPPPLEVSVEQTIPISCNGGNQFNNPSDDGQLLATASGGVPFDPLMDGQYAYIYTWKKKDEQNNWQIIPNVTGNVLDNVDAGEYAVNIEDANGIILGIYVDNVLQEPTDYEYPVQETDPITLQLDKMDVSCFNDNDGFATVAIEGGMPPYDISWSSGAHTEVAENLTAGTYFVYVVDFYGCEVSAQVTIDQPEELAINVIETASPTCYDSEDGSISVEITGGIPPYTYLWNVDEVSLSLNNIGQGTYNLEVVDAVGCTISKEIVLEAPFPTQVNLGGNRTLCNGQEHYLDISVDDPAATYEWTSNNGFYSNSSQVQLSEAGIYTATVTNSLGCSGSDTIQITTTQTEIDSQFLITSQAFAGEDVVLVNTSNPIGTNEEWVFPVGMEVVEQEKGTVIVRFKEPGAYEVILRNYQGDCYQDITKSIIVAEARELPDVGEAIAPFIKEFKVFPNPSSGTFTVVVSLQEASSATLRLFGLTTNHIYDEQQLQDSAYYQVPYAMDLASGVYLLLLETSKGSEIRKIVIL